jgi:hypothetical protein
MIMESVLAILAASGSKRGNPLGGVPPQLSFLEGDQAGSPIQCS